MLKLIGAVMLVACGAFAGMGRLSALRREMAVLRALDTALAIMAGELEFCARPLPELFALISERSGGKVSAFFSELEEKCCRKSFAEAWKDCCRSALLPTAAVGTILPLGDVLGMYDIPRQCAEISLARRNLGLELEKLEERLRTKDRFWPALGACAAGMAAMLII